MTSQPDDKTRKPDLKVLQGELENPTPATPEDPQDQGQDQKPFQEGSCTPKPGDIFPNCPVVALGVYGDTFFYLDYLGQLAPVTNHTKDRMRGIFGGRSEILMNEFPQYNKGGDVSGWAQEDTATAMTRACTDKGVWNAFEKVRGLGAWPDGEGGASLHCGDAILYKGRWKAPGEIDGYVYPSAPRTPRPLEEAVDGGEGSPGYELQEMLATWNWMRGDIDAYLVLGWICGAMFGGAMDWRPLLWFTGDAGTGKSTLQKLIRYVMGGEGAILQSTDATEASVRQFLMQSTIPVALDEVEAEADNRKVLSVVKLARQAASGGVVLRGGADHKGQEFRARSSFVFSSILVPALLDQDISRIALLEMLPLKQGQTPPVIEQKQWLKIGRGLRTRILDGWPRLHETLELYRQALSIAGHNARGCDQFGTLLTMADLAMHDGIPDQARVTAWAAKLSAAVIEEQTDQSTDWQRCMNHLFGQTLDVFRSGEKLTVGRWILGAAGLEDEIDQKKAERALSSVGMRVYGKGESAQLAIANAHPGLSDLFRDSHWYASAGLRGVWAQATKRIPGSTATGMLRFDMVGSRTRKFPLKSIPNLFGDDEVLEEAQPPQAPHSPDKPNPLDDFA